MKTHTRAKNTKREKEGPFSPVRRDKTERTGEKVIRSRNTKKYGEREGRVPHDPQKRLSEANHCYGFFILQPREGDNKKGTFFG